MKEPVVNKLIFISLVNVMGGAEQLLLMLAKLSSSPLLFLKRKDLNSLNCEDIENVRFVTRKSLFFGFLYLLKEIYPYRDGYTIISSHAYLNAYLGFLKRIGYLKSTLIVRESTSIFTRFTGFKRLTYKLAYKFGYPAINRIICQTDSMKSQLLSNNPFISAQKVITQHNPIDLTQAILKANEILNDPDLSDDFICAAGRLISLKGFSVLIDSFHDTSRRFPSLKLFILGSGPEKNNLTEQIQRLNLEDKVILKGHRNNPYPYFKFAKLCVVSSIIEGFPNVLLQMMAVNNSVVSTLCAGGIENINGIYKAMPGDKEALTNAMLTALATDNAEKRKYFDQLLVEREPSTFMQSMLDFSNI